VDGTFKVVREPPKQLFSVHAFVSKEEQLKQLPLAFALMSRRRSKDYRSVLKELLACMSRRPSVQAVVSDFERAVWSAVSSTLSGVVQRGCAFHFGQAVWRNVQSLGLQQAYASDDGVRRLCRKTLALPFLPADAIVDAVTALQHEARHHNLLTQHLTYIEQNWVQSSVWPPSAWSVYRQPVRTNNDVEGWHHRLNAKAHHGRLNMYQLIQLLKAEADMITVNVKLLSEGKAARLQRRAYTDLHTRVSQYWEEYRAGTRSAARLLSACARACKQG